MELLQILSTIVLWGVAGVVGQITETDTNYVCEGAVTLHMADSSTVIYKSSQFSEGAVKGVNHKYEEVTMTGSCCFLLYQSPKARGKTHRLNSPVNKQKSHLKKVGAVNTTACLRRGGAPIVPIVCGLLAIIVIVIAVVVIKKKCFKKEHKPVPTEEELKTVSAS